MSTPPVADAVMIRRALSVLFEPGDVVELRAFRHRRNTCSGYYDDRDALAQDAVQLNKHCGSVYVSLNRVDPALLARRANRCQEYVDTTTSDLQIIRRRWLPIDLDPVRPSGISSSDTEHEAAKNFSRSIYRFLVHELGFPRPVVGDSGNGLHLLCRIDLSNDDASCRLIKRCLEALADRFHNDQVVTDVTNHNAARIWKLYGTVAAKGDNVPDRPHRLSRLLHVPDPIQVVTAEQLQRLADLLPAPSFSLSQIGSGFDVGQWLRDHNIDVLYVDSNYRGKLGPGRKWVLERCVWNPDHTDKAAFVIQFDDGPIVAGCQHNGCAGKGWKDLRAAVECRIESIDRETDDVREKRDKREKSSLPPPSDPLFALKGVFAPENLAPQPIDAAAFHGLAGDVVRTIEPHSEADPIAILVQFLTAFGNAAGRSAFFQVESDRHFLTLFVVLVGRSSKARKGTSWAHVLRLFERADWRWVEDHVANGLSSGEGLIWAVRDEIRKNQPQREEGKIVGYHEVISDAGVKDKRLLCVESEFAATLKVVRREGNTLSPVVRNAWDRGNLQTLTKNSPAKATGTHISLIGHITEEELRRELTATEICNGFGNRFLWLWVQRSKCLPHGGGLTEDALKPLAVRLVEALEAARWLEKMERDETTDRLWEAVYPELSREQSGILGSLASRGEAQTMRLACIYAALDQSVMIRRPHLEAALAVWGYAEDSIRHIFGDALGDPVADEILRVLRQRPDGVSRNDIRTLFGGHCSSRCISAALATLQRLGRAHVYREETGGRPKEIWLATGSARKQL